MELLGKSLDVLPILYDDSKNGAITLHEEGLEIRANFRIQAPFNYVESITEEKKLALLKSQAVMVVYNMLGEKFELRFIIAENDLAYLKKACGK
ncbi:MAG: hypothetical protein Sv326_0244 [Candidatus Fermentimicrarchaeum limneticum]|uniref:Uncharacterized protein n=1 Tax=Fermentimicrarchaeum limneticum TaxID=2795018 RepID=A0A7D6BBS0_FERL1|nr:MAG: hypothetical protein Sv326_0244 [Candidatus Fermentimicrarchaeum limneticum]